MATKKLSTITPFKNESVFLKKISAKALVKKTESEQIFEICRWLLGEIQKSPSPCFLLPKVLHFFKQLQIKRSDLKLSFFHFEFWLNQFSELSEEQNYLVRAKISGKFLPKSAYQTLFPIGLKKEYAGSHYVTAHGSPDIDTTIASFWGWLDAFSAKISSSLHIWNMPPGGIMSTKEASPLTDFLGENLLEHLCQSRSSLAPQAIDFTTQKKLCYKKLQDSSVNQERFEEPTHPVLVLDDKGFFMGDLCSQDFENIASLSHVILTQWQNFANLLQTKLIAIFSQKKVSLQSFEKCLDLLKKLLLSDLFEGRVFSSALKKQVLRFYEKVLDLKNPLTTTIESAAQAFSKKGVSKFFGFLIDLEKLFKKHKVFSDSGKLNDQRDQIFHAFAALASKLDSSLKEVSIYLESVDVALQIKQKVFNLPKHYVTGGATLDEIHDQMGSYNSLVVVYPNKDGSLFPLGIIHREDLSAKHLGTVTLRDFCNREEVKIDPQFEIISVLDHHKASLKTMVAPTIQIADVQSCNVLLAELAFSTYKNYSFLGMSIKQIERDLKALKSKPMSISNTLLTQRLLQKSLVYSKNKSYYVDPERELLEYLSYIHAIIDDTDLLSKVTPRDVTCVAELLNRIDSLKQKKESLCVSLDDFEIEEGFAKKAAQRIVTHEKMYDIYKEIYIKREKEIDAAIVSTATGKTLELFSDTKQQNGLARVGQTKVFRKNIALLSKNLNKLIRVWLEKAQEVYSNNEAVDLHLQMVSTIASAEDVYKNGIIQQTHKDMIWVWAPDSQEALNHLSLFLNAFKKAPELNANHIEYQVTGSMSLDVKKLLDYHFKEASPKKTLKLDLDKKKMPLIIFTFDPGTLNSRKAQITPYLPALTK